MRIHKILAEIVEHKVEEVAEHKAALPQAELEASLADLPAPRDFPAALRGRPDVDGGPDVRVIAEMKRSSPSHGPFTDLYDPRILAQEYAGNGAAALSVLTDERYFGGQGFDLRRARRYVPLPLLRKDFVIDTYQVYEARSWLADAVLLIVAIVDEPLLRDLLRLAGELGLAALVECHVAEEVEAALRSGAEIVGINNRDLTTFTVDIARTEELARLVPPECSLVAESGIGSRADLERLAAAGIDAALIGTALMKETEPGVALRQFIGVESRRHARG